MRCSPLATVVPAGVYYRHDRSDAEGVLMLAALLILTLIGTGLFYFRSLSKKSDHARYVQNVRTVCELATPIIAEHINVLVRKRRTLVHVDEYGIRDESKWLTEARRFLDKVLLPQLSVITQPTQIQSLPPRCLIEFIFIYVATEESARETSFSEKFDKTMTPIEYEHFCAARLRSSGWIATVTQASWDQGADVIATRGDHTVVLQCKHYNAAAGNKAVQEVAAATKHYGGTIAAVIAPNGFTKSAYSLAETNGVMLLDHDDLIAHPRFRGDVQSTSPSPIAPTANDVVRILPSRGGWWQRTLGG